MSDTPRGCLGLLFRLAGIKGPSKPPPRPSTPKVWVNKFFVTDAEANFFRVLSRVVDTRGHILAQVSLRQLLWLPGNNQTNPGRSTWQNKIAMKSVDFVIADPATLRPLLVLELDEPSHARPERQMRDEEVEAVLRAAGMPVLRVLTSRSYDMRELEATIGPYLLRQRTTTTELDVDHQGLVCGADC